MHLTIPVWTFTGGPAGGSFDPRDLHYSNRD